MILWQFCFINFKNLDTIYKEQYFKFKRFGLFHGCNSFKIGTDSVILGAWAGRRRRPKNILDIGTGSGVIALMLAQRFHSASVHAIDIDQGSCKIAHKNFIDAPFNNRMNISNVDLNLFYPLERFDLMVSNPPFFNESFLPLNQTNARSKHNTSISISNIFSFAKHNLSDHGIISIIYPYHNKGLLTKEALENELHLVSSLTVFPNPGQKANRCVLEFSKTRCQSQHEEKLTIENGKRHEYHPSYRNLCKDFYLNF